MVTCNLRVDANRIHKGKRWYVHMQQLLGFFQMLQPCLLGGWQLCIDPPDMLDHHVIWRELIPMFSMHVHVGELGLLLGTLYPITTSEANGWRWG